MQSHGSLRVERLDKAIVLPFACPSPMGHVADSCHFDAESGAGSCRYTRKASTTVTCPLWRHIERLLWALPCTTSGLSQLRLSTLTPAPSSKVRRTSIRRDLYDYCQLMEPVFVYIVAGDVKCLSKILADNYMYVSYTNKIENDFSPVHARHGPGTRALWVSEYSTCPTLCASSELGSIAFNKCNNGFYCLIEQRFAGCDIAMDQVHEHIQLHDAGLRRASEVFGRDFLQRDRPGQARGDCPRKQSRLQAIQACAELH
eukprot:scaffold547_cov384-Prasinococcus_capsulatus_cf.AAC.7